MSVPDPYKMLQVDPEAEVEVIEAAYRRLARKYHPDISPGPESLERMIAINQAWEQLRDPVRRAAVDQARGHANGAAAWAAAADARARTTHPDSRTGTTQREPPGAAPRAGFSSAGSVGAEASTPPGGPQPSFGSMSDPAFESAGPGAQQPPTAGRVPIGGSASGASIRPEGEGAAGPPPGNPSGSVLNFGRYAGWSIGEIARYDAEYLEWLDRMPIGRVYQHEIGETLRARGLRATQAPQERPRGGLFRRR